MSFVLCKLPNASSKINDVEFVPAEGGGMISAKEVEPDLASYFAEIKGYELVDAPPKASKKASAADKVT
jgi:hypothetical protein